MNRMALTIAVDGPAGSGKTSISEELARLLGYRFVPTGNMFRGIALLANGNRDESAVIAIAENADFEFVYRNGFRTILNGADITDEITSPGIVPFTSEIAQIQAVRTALLKQQKELAASGGVIMEGRDVGTVVAPAADVKIFLDADFSVRAERLFGLLTAEEKTRFGSAQEYADALAEVDKRDGARLAVLPDAIYHKTGRFTAREEAVVLYHYVMQRDEVIRNGKLLSRGGPSGST